MSSVWSDRDHSKVLICETAALLASKKRQQKSYDNRRGCKKLAARNRAQKTCTRMFYERFSLPAYTLLVTHFDLVFRKFDFFNTLRPGTHPACNISKRALANR